MYYLLLIHHPKSNLYEVPLKDKEVLVKEFIDRDSDKPKDFKFDLDDPIIKQYTETINNALLTKAQRFLSNWQKKLEERDEFISSTPYTLSTADQLDRIMANSDKLNATLQKAIKELNQEEELLFGGEVESFLEQHD